MTPEHEFEKVRRKRAPGRHTRKARARQAGNRRAAALRILTALETAVRKVRYDHRA